MKVFLSSEFGKKDDCGRDTQSPFFASTAKLILCKENLVELKKLQGKVYCWKVRYKSDSEDSIGHHQLQKSAPTTLEDVNEAGCGLRSRN
jgi:hypothetical protein